MTVPFAAITSFNDPSVGFGLQFEMPEDEDEQEAESAAENSEGGANSEMTSKTEQTESAEVVSLDSFRKTPS